ncbi:MAG TPA: alpha-glucosidase/alpha-galactosidase [Anaerolinea thermolimosa]|uniref:Alpha-glucosidase/alpha-galactosidase n=1 Tax=Anaerolinea thermolimosa TaxID=229919 RepID=A0A3D1JDR3_9CHLR|nr:alpha-galactosidase [Anaerolinea thermolimosa]GAP06215.1 alpha-galactosidases/6-phospho-beta-glucosidases, family 4 of glycosyl hydrolases [Anaerolinea thermolimosa]HCE16730.1 alpha-glucosidase/alpha-galactosidase [Anaerolinea thermolimosa]
MTKITFIGAGSFGFTRGLVRDVLTFPLLRDAEICLMDIDDERLDFALKSVQKIIQLGNYPAKVWATKDRIEALKGADVVLVTILVGSTDVWRHDIEIPKKYNVDFNVGDTRGTAGIFRALRTIPVMVSIAKDMEQYCPDALMLNYTNPMAMLCRAMNRASNIQLTGLCHSVQGTAEMLAKWIGAPMSEITYTCAGINHQAFYLKYEWNGKDAYPLLREAIEKPEIYNEEIVRNEMFKALGYYVTESSGHNSEYNWWFRKRQDLIEKYCTHGTGWNPGVHAYILKEYQRREGDWKEEAKKWFAKETPISLERGHEYAAYIINAIKGGETFQFNGNVPNTKLITNLPDDVCVEVPVFVDKAGLHPVHVGALPPQLVALNHLSVMTEEMAVEAALTGDPTLVYQACCYDPLAASVLSLAEIRSMVNELLEINRPYLPQFKHFKA